MKKKQFICMGLVCAIFWGCSGKKSGYQSASTADTAGATMRGENVTDTAFSKSKLVKTANMKFKVTDVEKSGEDISGLTKRYNGMVIHHTMESIVQKSGDVPLSNDSVRHVTSYKTTAEITVKIPPALTEEFMNQVSKMAVYIDVRNMNVQDKTLDYISSKMKIANRSAALKHEKPEIGNVKDSLDFLSAKDDLVDRKINNLYTDAEVKYSTIALTLYQNTTVAKNIVINDDPSAYRLPFRNRIRMAFENGWLVVNEILIFLINLWPAILAGVAGWFCYKYFARKKPTVI